MSSLASSGEAKTEEQLLIVDEDIFERCSSSESVSAMVLLDEEMGWRVIQTTVQNGEKQDPCVARPLSTFF